MGLKAGELTAYLDLDDKGYNSKIDTAETKATGMGSRLGTIAGAIGGAAITGKVVGFFQDATAGASDLQESASKVGVVFGDSTGLVRDFASTSATSMGISEQAALEAIGTFGNLMTALDIGQAPAADMSTSLVQLAGDLASFNNVDPDVALEALRAGLTGETEPLKKFGVNMNEATLKAKAMELGLSDGKGVLDANAKAQAAYALIMAQTTTAQGDFARTSDGLANSQRIAGAQWKDISATLGTALLPVITSVVGGFSSLLSAFTSLPGPVQQVIGVVAGIAAALAGIALVAGPLIGGFSALAGILPVLGGAFSLLLGPVGLVVLAIAAVIAIGVLLYKHWDEVSAFMGKVWDGIKSTAETVWGAIKAFFVKYWPILLVVFTGGMALIPVLIAKNWDAIKSKTSQVWNAIKEFLSGVWKAIASAASSVFNGMKSAVVSIWEGLKSAVMTVVNALKSGVTTGFTTLVSSAKSVLAPLAGFIEAPFKAGKLLVDTVLALIKSVVSGNFGAIPGIVTNALSGLAEIVVAPFRNAYNKVVEWVGKIRDKAAKLNPFATDSPAPADLIIAGWVELDKQLDEMMGNTYKTTSKWTGAIRTDLGSMMDAAVEAAKTPAPRTYLDMGQPAPVYKTPEELYADWVRSGGPALREAQKIPVLQGASHLDMGGVVINIQASPTAEATANTVVSRLAAMGVPA